MIEKKNASLAVLINIYFMMFCLVFCHLRYGAIDDYFMAGILSGIFGNEYNVHMLFVNAIYGYLLLPLYHLFPQVSWYYIGELASVFVSLTLVTYILLEKMGRNWGGIISILMVAAYAKDLYIVMQFTQCAEILSAAGMVVLIETFALLRNDQMKKTTYAFLSIGIMCLWWGSFMRWDAFLMGTPFLAAALLLCVRELWKIRFRVILTLLIVFVGAFAFHSFDKLLYQSPEYKTFVDFQPFRVLLGDGTFYNEQAVYEDLQEMGLQSNDFDLLKKWVFYDNEVFAPESVQSVTHLIDEYTVRPHLKSYPMLLLQNLSHMAITPIFMLWLAFGTILLISDKRRFAYFWICLFFIVLALSYFLYIDRVVYRVEMGLWLYATLLMIPFWKRMPYVSFKVLRGIAVVLLLIISVVFYNNRNEFRSPNNAGAVSVEKVLDTKGYDRLFAYMESMPDSILFVVPVSTYMDFSEHRMPPYLTEPKGCWQHIVSTGFWTPYFPDVENSFRKRGMTNPIKDLVKENVYYVDNLKHGLSLVDFLENHHYNHVSVDTVEKFDDLVVLKYTVNENLISEK